MTDTSIRIIILEDHPMMRETLESRLVHLSDDITIAYSGDSISDALRAGETRVDCIVLDLDLGDGTAFTENLTALEALQAPILVVSATASPRAVQISMARGVKGYISKQSSAEEFTQAVRAVLRGDPYLSAELAGMLASDTGSQVVLSAQEQRALLLYSSGMKLESVARRMDVAPATVKEYIRRVRAKYAAAGTPVPTKVEMYRMAQEEGLL